MNAKIKTRDTDRLCEAIVSLRSVEECYNLLEDLLTIGELQSIAQRLAVAEMLDQGQTYDEIEQSTGASSATISRVKRALAFGADGYRMVLDRLHGAG